MKEIYRAFSEVYLQAAKAKINNGVMMAYFVLARLRALPAVSLDMVQYMIQQCPPPMETYWSSGFQN